MRRRVTLAVLVAGASAVACGRAAAPPREAVRLVDAYRAEAVEGRVAQPQAPPPTEWRFDGEASPAAKGSATRGWEAYHGIASLAIKDGRLTGRAADALPILHFERKSGLDTPDQVHALEVRMRVSGGGNASVSLVGAETLDRDVTMDYARNFPWDLTTPIVAGGEMQTYTLTTTLHLLTSRTRHVFLRPTDQAGATFEIESVRIVPRSEHLASVPSGIGWQGLSEVYRETIVSRSPEVVRLRVRLPSPARLDLALGTVEDTPVTFRVAVQPDGAKETEVLARTLTRAYRWDPAPVDLSAFAGREVGLTLSVTGDRPGRIGFWGSPTVRRPVERAAGAAPQGVILVWLDTTRRDHLGPYGYSRPTTPTLDRLAREGTLFRDCIGQATWTKVQTPSLLASLYPTTHTVHDFFDRLPSSAETLAEVYREAGYATVSYSSILFTGQFTNLHQGFEEVHEQGSLPDASSSKTGREYVDRLLPWLEAHRDVPFFVLLHVADPHDPYRPYPPYDTMWADAQRNETQARDDKALIKVIADPLLRRMGNPMPTRGELVAARLDPEKHVGHNRDWYDGSIRALDAELGRLVERLQGTGLDTRTLLVVTADHGEEFLEHGRTFHGQGVYGELNQVPLVFWRPGTVPSGRVVDHTVQTIDIMPTLLEASGLRPPAAAQGRSLLPLFSGPDRGAVQAASTAAWEDRPAITEKLATPGSSAGGAPPPRDTESFSIVARGFKLIHNTRRGAGMPEYEVYDHANDPLDRKDVAAAHPEVVESLGRELAAWRKLVEAARLKPDAESAKGLSKEDLERLRALGYVQ